MSNRWRWTALGGLLVGGITLAMLFLRIQNLPWLSPSVTTIQAQSAQRAAAPLDGTYSGAVDLEWTLAGLYSDALPTPAPPTTQPALGSIDLALQLTQTGNSLTGYVDLEHTLIFSVEHTINGTPVGPIVNGSFDGVNLILESERIAAVSAGRSLARQFRLTGAIVEGDPAKVSGQYRETLWGYAPQPVTVLGSFTLQRPVFTNSAPDTSNQTPAAGADTAITAQGVAVTLNVLANDTDGNGDALTVTSVSKPQFGTATTDGQQVIYTSNANFSGNDHFSYFVSDGKGGTAAGSVTIIVNGANGPNQSPIAANDTATTAPSTTVIIDVLGNDADPNGDALLITIDGPPSNGTTIVENGKIVYTPHTGFVGTESFTYIVSDGKDGTATATVTVQVTEQSGGQDFSLYLPIIQR